MNIWFDRSGINSWIIPVDWAQLSFARLVRAETRLMRDLGDFGLPIRSQSATSFQQKIQCNLRIKCKIVLQNEFLLDAFCWISNGWWSKRKWFDRSRASIYRDNRLKLDAIWAYNPGLLAIKSSAGCYLRVSNVFIESLDSNAFQCIKTADPWCK